MIPKKGLNFRYFIRPWAFVIIFQLFSHNALAVESKGGGWVGTFTDTPISKVFSAWAEAQLRYTQAIGGISQLLYRIGLLQNNLSDNHRLGYLYAFIRTETFKEHRFALQHTMRYRSIFGQYFSHRARLEGRFLEGAFENSARFRYMLRGDRPFEKSSIQFVFWNEFFLNLTRERWTGDKTFDQNRLFIGFKYDILGSNRFELGYLNQYIPRKSVKVMNHLLVFYYFYKS